MTTRWLRGVSHLLLLVGVMACASSARAQQERRAAPLIERLPLRYQVIASSPRLNRKVLGPVTSSVRGVPAEPVDSMCYDGDGYTPVEGQAILEVDIRRQRGLLRAHWTDGHGKWELRQDYYHHPEHLSGIRVGSSRSKIEEIVNLGIVHNLYLHGDTGAGTPVQPTVFTYLGTWGFMEVTLDGEPFENPFGWPGPERWLGHANLTEGVRDERDGTIRTVDGRIYDPQRDKSVGATAPDDLELHLAFHDERFPATTNIPAMFAFEYHLIFEDIVVRILDSQTPLDFDDYVVPWNNSTR